MLRWTSLVLGAATFLAAHAVERALWRSWFSAEWEPFFMNSGRAVAFTAACVLIAGLLAALLARDRRDALIHAGNVTAGAAAVMISHAVLGRARHAVSRSRSSLGIAILAAGSYLGALATFPFKAPGRGAGDARGRSRI